MGPDWQRRATFDGRAPGQRRRRSMALLVVAGFIAALVIVTTGYVLAGVKVAGDDRQSAEGILQRAGQADQSIHDAMQIPDFTKLGPPPTADLPGLKLWYVQLKNAADDYRSRYQRAADSVNADLPDLRRMSSQLQSASGDIHLPPQGVSWDLGRRLVVAPHRSPLMKERDRLDSTATGFVVATRFFHLAGQEVGLISSVSDAMSSLVDVEATLLEKNDVESALALYPDVDRKVQQAVAQSKVADMPAELRQLTDVMSAVTADFKQALQAVHAQDPRAWDAAWRKLGAEGKDVAVTPGSLKTAQAKLLQPLVTQYEKALQQAGFRDGGRPSSTS